MFYRNIRLLILTIILIIFWGLSSFQILPRMEDPQLTQRVATIRTFFSGANAQRVESLVTEKIEEELQEIEEIKVLESTSTSGISLITVELRDEIKEVEPVFSRIRDKLDDVIPELPPEATKPEFEKAKLIAYAMIAALTWEEDTPPNYAILRRRAQLLEERLRSVSGTEEVELRGEPDEEILVEINPTDLASLGLNAQQLAQKIQQSDAKISSGQFRSNENDLLLEVDSELDSLDRIRRIPITNGMGGEFSRLGDIALVKKHIKLPPDDIAIVNGKDAVALTVIVRSQERIDVWAKKAEKAIAKFRKELPRGIGLDVIFSQSDYVENRLDTLITNLLIGALMVFAVTLLMMGWQSAMVVSLALPLSGLMVFAGMRLLNIPLHQMSVTGLIVALGLLIDNAIVVVDEVQNHLKEGEKPTVAIQKSVDYLLVPLLASTLTTILAFLPIAMLSGPTGEFVGAIGINVIIALISSLAISLTIIPALTARLYKLTNKGRKPYAPTKTPQYQVFTPRRILQNGISLSWLTRIYNWTLKRTFATPVIGIGLALVLPITGFVQGMSLPEQFFPPADRDQFQIEIELPSSYSLKQTRIFTEEMKDIILAHEDIDKVHWFIGRNAPKFYYNLIENRENTSHYAQALVQATFPTVTNELIPVLQEELDLAYPQARILVRQLEQGPPVDAPVEMRIYGSDLNQLRILGQQLRRELVQVAHVTHTRDSLSEDISKLGLQVDEENARLTGLDNTTIAQELQAITEGVTGGSILEDTEELPVRVRLSNSQRGNLDEISSLDLVHDNNTIPLSAIASVKLLPELSEIERRNGQRVNTIQGFIERGILPAQVLNEFNQRLEAIDFQLPSGYRLEIGGEAAERDNAVGGLLSLVGLLLILMVTTLVLSLGSFRLAMIIGIVGVCSVGLALFSLWLFGYPFGFMAIIGAIGLVGVAINDSIVVLSAIKENPEARRGNRRAIRETVLHSTRHVLTTTLTTMIGFVPLLLDKGGFWPPLAVAITGGIAGATLLALYFVPSAYLLVTSSGVARQRLRVS